MGCAGGCEDRKNRKNEYHGGTMVTEENTTNLKGVGHVVAPQCLVINHTRNKMGAYIVK